MPSFFERFVRIGRLPEPLRAELEPAKVVISDEGMHLDLDVTHVDPWFRGHLSLNYKMSVAHDVLAALPSRSLSFGVSTDYVFHLLGVRVRT
jgi:hypothetical protein